MSDRDAPPLREYIGFVWIDDQPGIRVRVTAASLSDARAQLVDEYGDKSTISIRNEDDASRPRS